MCTLCCVPVHIVNHTPATHVYTLLHTCPHRQPHTCNSRIIKHTPATHVYTLLHTCPHRQPHTCNSRIINHTPATHVYTLLHTCPHRQPHTCNSRIINHTPATHVYTLLHTCPHRQPHTCNSRVHSTAYLSKLSITHLQLTCTLYCVPVQIVDHIPAANISSQFLHSTTYMTILFEWCQLVF